MIPATENDSFKCSSPPEVNQQQKNPSFYKMYNVGKGQIAVAEEGFQDPYQVAVDTHLLVSRRNDLVRLYNPAVDELPFEY